MSISSTPTRRRLTDDQCRCAFQAVRIGDLTKVFGHRYGGGRLYVFPDDDAGRDDLRSLIDHYAHANPAAIQRVIKARAPWLTGAERDRFIVEVARFPRLWTAQALAERLNLTESVRSSLRIRTIGAVDVTPELRKQMRRLEDRYRKARARRDAGMKLRGEYEADSISRARPWETEGISRRTWYRRRGTSPSAIKLATATDTPVPIELARPSDCGSGSASTSRTERAVRPKESSGRAIRGHGPNGGAVPTVTHPDGVAAHRQARMLREGAESPGDSESCDAGFVPISECINAAVALAERAARFDRKDNEIDFKEAA